MDDGRGYPRLPSRARAAGQRGSILLMVLAVVGFLTIAVLGLLTFTTSTRQVADRLELDTKAVHTIDGAMEKALNQVRDDDDLDSDGQLDICDGSILANATTGDYQVRCTPPTGWVEADETRVIDLEAIDANGGSVGFAKVKVTDWIQSTRVVGHSVEICDWLLAPRASDQLRGCVT